MIPGTELIPDSNITVKKSIYQMYNETAQNQDYLDTKDKIYAGNAKDFN